MLVSAAEDPQVRCRAEYTPLSMPQPAPASVVPRGQATRNAQPGGRPIDEGFEAAAPHNGEPTCTIGGLDPVGVSGSLRGQQGVTGPGMHIPVRHPEQHLAFQDVKDLVFIEVDVERW